ncbi:MAG: nucleotidyltransferase domain-containing protein [Anaerolineae bacterium]|nr:nucleotidyltransferase domain-containing protein [Anaerolineae bacterium]
MTINPHTQWRLDVARHLAEQIRAFPGVQAIIVGGSVARGYADAYSDLELPIFWDALPPDETRLALVVALQGEFLHGYDGPAQEDQLLIDGFQVDLWHNTVAGEEVVIKRVLEDYSTDFGDSNFMDTVRACIPLYGDVIIQKWKRQAVQYPDALALKNIQEHITAFDAGQLAVLAYRDNPTVFYAAISQLQEAMFLVLLALNRRYFPTFKWMYQVLATMPVRPVAIEQRFRQAFRTPYDAAVQDMVRLLHETLDLVQCHFPHLDTTAVARRLAYTRAAHTGTLTD